jgi:muramidase (phage lysozyme)
MIAHSEIGAALLAVSDNGYNVLVGSTATHPLLFTDYSTHPNILNVKCNSTAAGRYQVLHRYAEYYTKMLNLPDFGPESQDKIAMQYLKECRALDDINAGHFDSAVGLCSHIWASLPGAGYQQHENHMADLALAFTGAGGILA